MAYRLIFAAGSDPGRMRQSNEDQVFVYVSPNSDGPLGLIIVADGMGGHQAGEVASELAVKTIFQQLQFFLDGVDGSASTNLAAEPSQPFSRRETAPIGTQHLETAIQVANQVIYEYAQDHPTEAGNLGTTVACVLVRGRQALIANVGDSRVYHLRDHMLRQLTIDHSFVGQLVRQGQLDPAAVFDHPQRSVITRALGHQPEVEIDIFQQPLEGGDRLLVCSDGLWEMIREKKEITTHLLEAEHPKLAVKRLIGAANSNGGIDNIGVVVVEVVEESLDADSPV